MEKIAFFETSDLEKKYLQEKLSTLELSFFTEPLSPENIAQAKEFGIISPFICSKMDSGLLSQLPNLKMIATRSTGFDHIDIALAKEKNIAVCNVPFYGENTVAEHTFALILDLSRKIHESVDRTKMGNFSLDGLMGFDLKGKTIGIVGLGHIGQHVARMAKGFEMNIVAFDTVADKKMGKQLGLTYASLEDVLKQSDIITLHVPYNEHTRHLINANNITLVKKGAYLINTARGGLIETDALISALGDGTVAGAGLDVLEEENVVMEEAQLLSKEFLKTFDLKTLVENNMLLKEKNVIVTPHNAFNSQEAIERILDTTIENIQDFLKNKPVDLVK